MDNKTQKPEFLQVLDYLESADKNGNEEIADYCRQYLEKNFSLLPVKDADDTTSAPETPATPAADPNAAPVDPNAQTQANPAQPSA